MDRKDAEELESALGAFDKKVPAGKVPEKDTQFLKRAREMLETLQPNCMLLNKSPGTTRNYNGYVVYMHSL